MPLLRQEGGPEDDPPSQETGRVIMTSAFRVEGGHQVTTCLEPHPFCEGYDF